ncbi:MAG: AbrB/MazE/SpoVT family DNA-binding domain-containing protein [Bradyrhizobiaceae bacterium]|nr:AbrB/MazE/SpoVT family DNA-binding domain-containing protein [Bradyrhizobiaceae bacterium]
MPYAFPYRRTVTLTSKGQITLPVELRRSWNLKQGDQLDFVLTEDGAVQVRKHVRLSIHDDGDRLSSAGSPDST